MKYLSFSILFCCYFLCNIFLNVFHPWYWYWNWWTFFSLILIHPFFHGERFFFCMITFFEQSGYLFFCLSQVIFKKSYTYFAYTKSPPSIYTHQLMVTYTPEWVLKTECQKLLNKCLLFVYVLISMLLLCFPLYYLLLHHLLLLHFSCWLCTELLLACDWLLQSRVVFFSVLMNVDWKYCHTTRISLISASHQLKHAVVLLEPHQTCGILFLPLLKTYSNTGH